MKNPRILVAALTLSASAFIGLVVSEGYTERAVIPTKGDVPTMGFGSTIKEDGTKVTLQDRTTPVNALKTAQAHISKTEQQFRDSLPNAYLTQGEYNNYIDWIYQFGIGAWLKSSMRKDILTGKYPEACADLLKYKYSAGYDCSTPGNKVCYGVWTRQQQRYNSCMGAIQ